MNSTLISLKNVSKKFRKTQALKNIDLDISVSEITGIIGPDGAGKSTLMKICAGVLSFEGQGKFKNIDIRKDPEAMKKWLSFMPQGLGLNLYMDLSVEENIDFFAAIKDVPVNKRNELKEKLLSATGLIQFRTRHARNLSGGMKQKLGICCSLISNPEVVLLDEPSTGVDPLSRRQLWEILNSFITETGTTLILATSYMDEAERCYSVRFLHDGEILFSGDPEVLVSGYNDLENAFFNLLLRGKDIPYYEVPFEKTRIGLDDIAIDVQGVSKYFGSFKALDNISLTINTGEIFGFLGPNGAGKTTLLKCILSILKSDSGIIKVLGIDSREKEIKHRIGYMSQIFSLYGDLTVDENLELYGSLYSIDKENFRSRKDWVVNVAGLKGKGDTIVSRLPLGIKQRLALGCSALHLPDVLILDEPTSGVDPVARKSFWQLIRSLSQKLGMTVLVTTHNLVEADFCDRIAIMNEGKVIAINTPENLRQQFSESSGEVFEIYPETELDKTIFISENISIAPFGKRFHLWSKNLTEDKIQNILLSSNIRNKYIKRIKPLMEDVFIYFIERADSNELRKEQNSN